MRDYPYNTEAHLGRMNSLLVLQQIHHPEIDISLQQIKKMPLASPLQEWFIQLIKNTANAANKKKSIFQPIV